MELFSNKTKVSYHLEKHAFILKKPYCTIQKKKEHLILKPKNCFIDLNRLLSVSTERSMKKNIIKTSNSIKFYPISIIDTYKISKDTNKQRNRPTTSKIYYKPSSDINTVRENYTNINSRYNPKFSISTKISIMKSSKPNIITKNSILQKSDDLILFGRNPITKPTKTHDNFEKGIKALKSSIDIKKIYKRPQSGYSNNVITLSKNRIMQLQSYFIK